jgi:hypothetical protein
MDQIIRDYASGLSTQPVDVIRLHPFAAPDLIPFLCGKHIGHPTQRLHISIVDRNPQAIVFHADNDTVGGSSCPNILVIRSYRASQIVLGARRSYRWGQPSIDYKLILVNVLMRLCTHLDLIRREIATEADFECCFSLIKNPGL